MKQIVLESYRNGQKVGVPAAKRGAPRREPAAAAPAAN
jgi:hypothetical protein